MLTISPPRALGGGQIVDMVILGVIFFHDFNPNPNPNKIQWGGNSRLGQSGGGGLLTWSHVGPLK